MSQEGIKPLAELQNANIAQALMEEDLERELARNEAANRMAQEREAQALAARKRAEDSQKMMEDMLAKYELMKSKLDSTKKHLEETNTKITVQEELTDKIKRMKERVEAYSNRKDAVNFLKEHVKIKAQVTDMEIVEAGNGVHILSQEFMAAVTKDEPGNDGLFKDAVADNRELIDKVKAHCQESQERLRKREQLKELLEQQVEKGERRAEEQTRIAKAREELLELKLRELKLQQERLARRKEQQQRAEKDNEAFLAQIDKELEEMERRAEGPRQELAKKDGEREAKERQLAQLTHQRKKLEHARDMRAQLELTREKNRALEQMIAEKKAQMAAQGKEQQLEKPGQEQKDEKEEELIKDEEKKEAIEEKDKKPGEEERSARNKSTGALPKQTKHNKKHNKHSGGRASSEAPCAVQLAPDSNQFASAPTTPGRLLSPEPTSAASAPAAKTMHDNTTAAGELLYPEELDAAAADESGESLHPDISAAVRKIEGKCASVKGNLVDMAMSEQYLRTKQAMLLAKKKEQEMQIAENIAKLREAEVFKMREKVKHMQELLVQRKEKLKLTEAIMKEKVTEEEKLHKYIESKKRREHYCEKELIERIVFEKEPPKK